MAQNKAGEIQENPKAEDVYRADGTTNQVFIETPPSNAHYSCQQLAKNDDTDEGDTTKTHLVNALTAPAHSSFISATQSNIATE